MKSLCKKCKGLGFINHKQKNKLINCNICLGDGYANWIENIVGKKTADSNNPIHYSKAFNYTP